MTTTAIFNPTMDCMDNVVNGVHLEPFRVQQLLYIAAEYSHGLRREFDQLEVDGPHLALKALRLDGESGPGCD